MAHDIHFAPPALAKLKLYVKHCAGEVSGLGLIRMEEGEFYCDEVALLEQEAGTAHTDITPKGIDVFLDDILRNR